MDTKLQQNDFDDLSAYLDGELPSADARRVEQRIRDDAAWGQAYAELQTLSSAMDSLEAPAAPAGLAERIKNNIRAQEMQQDDFDDLSAYVDGELSLADAQRVEQKIRDDEAWGRAYAELQALSSAMDAFEAPAAPAGLAERIKKNIRAQERPAVLRLVKWLAPAAAAAAVLIAATLVYKAQTHATNPGPVAQALPTAAPAVQKVDDAFIVENLEFFRDLDVLNNMETIEAVQSAEESVGT